ncbi:MAG: hypothetical protein H7A37_06655 [Chlamydiales bacterium]|nr:hypothetical protein [Chlamydiia bacterium]MCP5507963.1 hypothetical protein [Chlamydiales bacterium]
MTWNVDINHDDTRYWCMEGPIKGSHIRIQTQNQFIENRYCEICLPDRWGSDTENCQLIYDELYKPIREVCRLVKNYLISPGLTEEFYAFVFHEGDDTSIIFMNCVKKLNDIVAIPDDRMKEIREKVLGI